MHVSSLKSSVMYGGLKMISRHLPVLTHPPAVVAVDTLELASHERATVHEDMRFCPQNKDLPQILHNCFDIP
jgi:hypothetical protein